MQRWPATSTEPEERFFAQHVKWVRHHDPEGLRRFAHHGTESVRSAILGGCIWRRCDERPDVAKMVPSTDDAWI
jgi:hypothetical protein